MRVLAPAVGAFLAAILESSVMAHLQVGDIRPDLVFAVGVAVGMVLGFESGMTWAFVGGLSLDLLMPGRALGSAALAMVLCTALALLVARAMWPPRIVAIAVTTMLLTPLYQAILMAILAVTGDVVPVLPSLADVAVIAFIDGALAALAVVAVRAIDLRFGDRERLAW